VVASKIIDQRQGNYTERVVWSRRRKEEMLLQQQFRSLAEKHPQQRRDPCRPWTMSSNEIPGTTPRERDGGK
jgi:hypothetical protein